MKKLMLFSTAFLLAYTGLSQLASCNIVGWADKGLQNNAQAIAPYFFSVGKDKVKLSDITVGGYEDMSSAEVRIQLLDEYGRMVTTYRWNDIPDRNVTAGWYNASRERITAENDVEFEPGQGLWVGAKEGRYLKMAGEVFMDDITFELHDNAQMLANPYATTLKLSQMTVTGYTGKSSAEVRIQLLDEYGRMINSYRWNDIPDRSVTAGWYNGARERITAENDVEFAAGQGLWVAGKDGYQIVVKSPLTKE